MENLMMTMDAKAMKALKAEKNAKLVELKKLVGTEAMNPTVNEMIIAIEKQIETIEFYIDKRRIN